MLIALVLPKVEALASESLLVVNPDFPTAEAIFLKKEGRLTMRLKKGQIIITEERQHKRQLFKSLRKYASESVHYSSFSPIREIEAETLTQRRGKTKPVAVDRFETEDVVQPGIFYGGYRRIKCTYPALETGVITSLRYTKHITEPRLITPFYFNDQLPVLEGTFSVICDSTIDLGYHLYGASKKKVNFQKESIGGQIRYTWSANRLPAFTHEANAPSYSRVSPHIVVFIKSFRVGQDRHRVSDDLSDLYDWYTQLINRIGASESTSAVDQVVAQLVAPLSNHREKVKTIFQWVQQNIKYVAFEDGMAGFIPRPAGDVLTKRYGDCKDMANLLKTMLHSAGIEGHLTWVGTRKKPYSYHDVPTTIADNHMICAVKEGDSYLFLDATSAHVPFGFPTSMIQGKEALVALDRNTYDLVEVPIVPRAENVHQDSVVIHLTPKGLLGSHHSTLEGYGNEEFMYKEGIASSKKREDFLRTYFDIDDNNVSIRQINAEQNASQEGKLDVSFNFELPHYGRRIGSQWYVNLNLHKDLPGELVNITTRQYAVENGFKYERRQKVLFPIPRGYALSHLPENQAITYEDFGFDIRYTVENDTIVLEKTIYVDSLHQGREQFPDWNTMITGLMQAYQETLVLSRHSNN